MSLEEGPQAKRIRELIEEYASFNLMPEQDRARVVHICGILAYLEIADAQHMTVLACIRSLEKFLKTIRTKYVVEEDKDEGNVIITD